MSLLFTPSKVGSVQLRNRIIIAPMCQYSAEEGCATDWHMIHLGNLALSGAGLLTIEATAVVPEGRISPDDLGLWSDDTEAALSRVLQAVRRYSDIPIAIQLAHAGRKASVRVPWEGGAQIKPNESRGWQTYAPSAIPFAEGDNPPVALDRGEMEIIREAFGEAAKRAARLGLDAIQIHAAHGYLLHEFLSPLANQRDDEYGGSLENRMRFPLEVYDVVRAAFPADRPVSVRVSGSDWAEGGWDSEQTVAFAKALEKRGCSAVHVSSGGLVPTQKIPVGPGYQVPLARAVKAATKLPTIAVGLITSYDHAEAIVANGDADFVALARTILYEPHWPWHAAAHLGATVKAPKQYLRSQPARYRHLLEG
ncbi:NADPH dehydrogenase [Candidatus Filomicrobium marinum]|uniref:NADPH dehydrogenase n=2 Tax=Filomicrobium TaxID=119044 RepID=A0A0D6JGB1_9HYPH|nr:MULTISPECIES: NADH:flavin oxidoreductase/NADH oxidase [Filomicrobium]CFX51350.1 NADPH dehydrogenase [Candidatus Filomicrobium marinum]CPR20136.1 NADPH dehydrogenase [Candidatus Filomicrobium marinum]SDP10818.1 2,4-dienoyl-CoA reductase [Filomicrobium insigne]